jgi:hypothetical protein
LERAMLVNSVNEYESPSSISMSGAALKGCAVDAQLTEPLVAASVRLHPCAGKYEKYGFDTLADVVIINYSMSGDVYPCVQKQPPLNPDDDARSDGERYATCVATNVRNGLQNFFDAIRERRERIGTQYPATIMMPALGTGIGKISKSRFYEQLGSELTDELRDPNSALPDRLILQLRVRKPDEQEAASYAISVMLQRLYHNRPAPRDYGIVGLLPGVFFGIAALALTAAVVKNKVKGLGSLQSDYFMPPLFYVIGCFVAALGVGSALVSAFLQGASGVPSWLEAPSGVVSCGAISVVLAHLLLLARREFENPSQDSSRSDEV